MVVDKDTAGSLVLAIADRAKLDVRMAAWMPDEDENWHLHLFTPKVRESGSRSVYSKLNNALRGHEGTVRLSDIVLHSDADPIYRAMQNAIHVDAGFVTIERSQFNGLYIEKMLLLRNR